MQGGWSKDQATEFVEVSEFAWITGQAASKPVILRRFGRVIADEKVVGEFWTTFGSVSAVDTHSVWLSIAIQDRCFTESYCSTAGGKI